MSKTRKPNSGRPSGGRPQQHQRPNGYRPGRPDDEPIEVIRLSTDAPVAEKELVDLFEIDGEMYQMWLNPPASVGLRYMKEAREKGTEAGAQFLLETMLDEGGYDALMDYEQLTDEQFEQIMRACEKYALGAKEKRQGNG